MSVRVLGHRVDGRGWEAEVELPSARRKLALHSETPVSADADRLLPALLPLAMHAGLPLSIPHPVSARLLGGAADAQSMLRLWRDGLSVVRVEAPLEERAAAGSGVGSFFSGGVDSFHTVLRHLDEITHLIFVVGFDVTPDRLALEEPVLEMARSVAAELGKELILVRTNVRQLAVPPLDWEIYHGPALASVGLSFQHTLRKLYVPASYSYADLIPWGSHPLLDPLWSTEALDVVHDGLDKLRVERVAAIAENETAMRWLRVCWETHGEYNCGRCEKCLRTVVNLEAVGAAGRCRTLPATIDRRAVSRLLIRDGALGYWRENIHMLRARNGDPALIRALEGASRPGLRQLVRDPLARATPERVKRMLRRSPAPPT
jgi:hypothetical protein